jgi:hypothetical protein
MALSILLTVFTTFAIGLALMLLELTAKPQEEQPDLEMIFNPNLVPDWAIPHIPQSRIHTMKSICKSNKDSVNWKHEGF